MKSTVLKQPINTHNSPYSSSYLPEMVHVGVPRKGQRPHIPLIPGHVQVRVEVTREETGLVLIRNDGGVGRGARHQKIGGSHLPLPVAAEYVVPFEYLGGE